MKCQEMRFSKWYSGRVKIWHFLLFFFPNILLAQEVCLEFFDQAESYKSSHAQHFTIKTKDGLTLLKTSDHKFVVLAAGNKNEPSVCQKKIIKTPLKNIIPTSTSALHFFELLEAQEVIKAYPSTRHISSNLLQKRVEKGALIDLGEEPELEWLIKLAPDLILTQGSFGFSQLSVAKRYRRISDVELSFLDYKEEHPLAKAEWIIFMGHLLNKEEQARQIFKRIKDRYNFFKQKAQANLKKKVLVGSFYQGQWSSPRPGSDFFQLLKDAGLESVNTPSLVGLNFEEVLLKIERAKIWLPQASWSSFDQALLVDERHLLLLQYFKESEIFPLKKSSSESMDFWEKGVARPDLVLSDLVRILQKPEKDASLQFYHNGAVKE